MALVVVVSGFEWVAWVLVRFVCVCVVEGWTDGRSEDLFRDARTRDNSTVDSVVIRTLRGERAVGAGCVARRFAHIV